MGNAGSSEEPPSTIALSRHRQGSVVKELAKGGFSTVLLVECEGDLLACKRVKCPGRSGEAEREALREIAAHNMLGGGVPVSPYIAALLESSVGLANDGAAKIITLVFPFYAQGSLASLLANGEALSEARALRIFFCLTDALAAAHSRDIAHLDVKTHNLMLQGGDDVVLIDFGSSVGPPAWAASATPSDRLAIKERAERFCSAPYRAPELWDPPFALSTLDYLKCDVFASGCVLFACLFPPVGFTPFESPTQGLLSLAARTASFKFPEVPVSNDIKLLISSCLQLDPGPRPSAAQLVGEAKKILSLVDFSTDFAAFKE